MLTELKLRIHFLLCIVALFLLTNTSKADSELPVLRGVGGDFFSDSSLGYEVNLSDYKDNIVLLFFGYTNCPDVCPLTLGYLNSVFTKLSIEQQQKVKVLFVTVNPEYDTPEHLKKYLETFNKAFIGISANPENLQKIAKLFKVSYEEVNQQIKLPVRYNRSRVEVDQDAVSKVFYHSISIFLLDKQNRVRAVRYSGTPVSQFYSDILQLLAENEPSKFKKNDIVFEDFWIRLMPANSRTTALYGKIKNYTNKTLQLVNIQCDDLAKKSHFHLTKIVADQAKMISQAQFTIKSHSTFTMKPASYHTMLMGLKAKLIENEKTTCALEFKNNRREKISVVVRRQ